MSAEVPANTSLTHSLEQLAKFDTEAADSWRGAVNAKTVAYSSKCFLRGEMEKQGVA